MGSRQERLADNQRTFRDANERFEEAVEKRVDGRGSVPFLCECADLQCRGRIEMTPSDYDAAHVDPDYYVILVGHPTIEGEEIVDRNDGYLIVEKNAG